MFKRISILYNGLKHYSHFWGLVSAIRIRIIAPILNKVIGQPNPKRENRYIMHYLRKEWTPIAEMYNHEKTLVQPVGIESPIWVSWWQGEEEMPEMIHKCYQSLLANSNGHPVHLITKNNYTKYIDLPPIVLKCLDENTITFTFLSDIIRTALIAKYGGVWIDSTYWVTQPLKINRNELFSIRQDRFKGQGGINDFQWTCHCIGTGGPCEVFAFINACLIKHLELHHRIVEYLLIDFAIKMAYETFPNFKYHIDNLPDTKEHIYIMPWLFNQKLDENKLMDIIDSTPILKLTYKQEYTRTTPDGSRTYYDWFINQQF